MSKEHAPNMMQIFLASLITINFGTDMDQNSESGKRFFFFFKKSDLPFHTAKLGRIEFSNLEMKTWSTDRVGVPGWSVHQGLWILVHILPLSCYATLDLSFLFFSCIALGCRAPNLVPLFYNESFFFLNGIWIILGSLVTPVYIFCSTIV